MKKKDLLKQSSLASYAVMKALTDSTNYHNSYEILADFIRYIIVDRKWHAFNITDVSNELKIEFGFDNIPIPAIKTSLKQIKECQKNGNNYVFPEGTTYDTNPFQRVKQISSTHSQSITQHLFDFATSHSEEIFRRDLLEDAFIKYILDDAETIEQKYSDIISEFIINNDGDEEFRNQISQIREGSILYCGLAYNISELGSIKSDLTLYLDTEVLFNIAGFNGLLYQKIAEDFLSQVKAANAKQKRIKLRFFKEVQLEIEGFFNSAENIVRGFGDLNPSTAMKSIVNGCDTVGDVRDKESDFFYRLKIQHGIMLDEKDSYYTEADYPYNIETIPEGFPNDERSFEAVKFISHINKLRKGENSNEYTMCGYLLITETRRIQEISNAMRTNSYFCGHALPTSVITNILWYKLGSGFSKKDYPINTDASIKARGILSGEIANKIARLFEETKRLYKEEKIDRDQVASRIVLLRDKNCTPDDITADNIDELLDFSAEYITRYEEGIKQNQVHLQEKQDIIDKLSSINNASIEQNARLTDEIAKITEERDASKVKMDEQNETIRKQEEELRRLRTAEKKRFDRIKWWKNLAKFLLGLLILMCVFGFSVYIVKIFLEHLAPQLNSTVKLVIDAVGVVAFVFSAIKYVWNRVYRKKREKNQ